MKVLELFSGTGGISAAFAARGHEVYRVDYNPDFEAESHKDVYNLYADEILNEFGKPDVIWASPDCTTYSVAAIGRYRMKEESGNLAPKTDYAHACDLVNMHLHNIMLMLSPCVWFIENPRGGVAQNGLHARA